MTEQTPLEKMRGFVAAYPGFDELAAIQVDYTGKIPDSAGLYPSGLQLVSREADVLGNVTCQNQYSYELFCLLEKSPDEDDGATFNAETMLAFQLWVQEQDARRNIPQFGDDPKHERITAQNGEIYAADDEGTALYVVQLTASFVNYYNN